jgi:REP element-mobilizing transposase RayT
MKDLYKKKYRIESTRLKNWDYSSPGAYFITICTKNKERYFGEIINGKMVLSEMGEVVRNEWEHTPAIRNDMNLIIDEFSIMPNHFHGIIFIGENNYNNGGRDAMLRVFSSKFTPQSKNLGSVIRGFKSAVTIFARKKGISFEWQPRFMNI